jgi:translation initiation factor IF-1
LKSFDGSGLDDAIAPTIAQEKFATPTPILVQTVPMVMPRRDVIGFAQTGTGKTAAFALPTPHRLAAWREGRRAHCGGAPIQKARGTAKEEPLQFDGLVTEISPDARYRIQPAGWTKKNRIKTRAGDRVTVEISPCDLEKGRLIFVTRTNGRGPARVRYSAINSGDGEQR